MRKEIKQRKFYILSLAVKLHSPVSTGELFIPLIEEKIYL